jgi:hypothetical protein
MHNHIPSMDLAVKHLRQQGVDLWHCRARFYAVEFQDYSKALQNTNAAKKKDSAVFAMLAQLYFFFGDAIQAHKLAIVAYERSRPHSVANSCELFKFLGLARLPSTLATTVPNGSYLAQIMSIACGESPPLVADLEIDLGIAQAFQNLWVAGEVVAPAPPLRKIGQVRGVEMEVLSPLLQAGFRYGEMLNRMGTNVRQQVCLGMAFVQVVQALKKPIALSLDRAVAMVGHWIRIYDPTAALFMRRKNPFTVFLWRNGIRLRQLDPYLTRVLVMMKNGLANGMEASMEQRLHAAQSPESLYRAIGGDAAVRTGSSTLFLRVGKNQNLDFGLSLPSLGAVFEQKFVEVQIIWEHLMILHEGEVSMTSAADFIHCAIQWVYDWMRLTPVVDGSHYIGSILFYALLASYFGAEFSEVRLTPLALHVEALLSADFEQYRLLIVQSYPVSFVPSPAIHELPNVSELLPTYPQRYLALWHVNNSPEFQPHFMRYVKAGFEEAPPPRNPASGQPPADQVSDEDAEASVEESTGSPAEESPDSPVEELPEDETEPLMEQVMEFPAAPSSDRSAENSPEPPTGDLPEPPAGDSPEPPHADAPEPASAQPA